MRYSGAKKVKGRVVLPWHESTISWRVLPGDVIKLVCEFYKVPTLEITKNKKNRKVTQVRNLIAYLLYEYTNMSIVDIAHCIQLHHTTALHGRDIIRNEQHIYPELSKAIEYVLERSHPNYGAIPTW